MPLMEKSLYKLTEGLKPEPIIMTFDKKDDAVSVLLAVLAEGQGFTDVLLNSIFSVQAEYEVERFCEYNVRGWVVDFVPRFTCQFTYGIGTRNLFTSSTATEALLCKITGAKERVTFDINPVEEVRFAGKDIDRNFVEELTYWRFIEKP